MYRCLQGVNTEIESWSYFFAERDLWREKYVWVKSLKADSEIQKKNVLLLLILFLINFLFIYLFYIDN